MVRVVKPGGRIVMGNWIPGDPTLVAQILRISGSYSPPPPEGFVSPVTWGVEEHIHERFNAAGVSSDRIACERDTYVFDFAGTPKEFVGMFRDYYGPTMNAFAAAESNGRAAELQAELEALFEAQNTSARTRPHRHPGHLHARHRDALTTLDPVPTFSRSRAPAADTDDRQLRHHPDPCRTTVEHVFGGTGGIRTPEPFGRPLSRRVQSSALPPFRPSRVPPGRGVRPGAAPSRSRWSRAG